MSTCILLATWNGARYLPDFLASLARQTIENWKLLVRDDSSTDGTSEILAQAALADRRIRVLHDARGRLGAAQNFGVLMQAALVLGFEHVAFADQDDVWIPQKIGRQLARMRAEEAVEPNAPLLVHTDLTVVDERLQTRHVSFMRSSNLPTDQQIRPNNLLVRNSVVGCTMLANRQLLELAVPAPPEMVMHDWWLGLLAASCGRLVYDDFATVLYRQHADNEIGAMALGQKLRAGLRNWRSEWDRALRNFRNGVWQARALRDRLRALPDLQRPAHFPLVDEYCRLFGEDRFFVGRLWRMQRLGIGDGEVGWWRSAMLAARVAAFDAARGQSPARIASSPHFHRKTSRAARSLDPMNDQPEADER